jgi:hypothetical protein
MKVPRPGWFLGDMATSAGRLFFKIQMRIEVLNVTTGKFVDKISAESSVGSLISHGYFIYFSDFKDDIFKVDAKNISYVQKWQSSRYARGLCAYDDILITFPGLEYNITDGTLVQDYGLPKKY